MNNIETKLRQKLLKLNTNELNEMVPETPAPSYMYGRHKVTEVEGERGMELHLSLKSEYQDVSRKAILQGFWADLKIVKGDIINIIGDFDKDGVCHVTDTQNYVIANPDILISGTSVVSGVHCMRRSVLNEHFKGCDEGNIYMLYGSIIHSFFQEVLKQGIRSKVKMMEIASKVVKDIKFLHDMYSQNVKGELVMEEIKKYIPQLLQWIQEYMPEKSKINGMKNDSLIITEVVDIEENIWSPKFGIKGKIDLTVDIEGPTGRKRVPLELKTGKPTFSIEHMGQVTLYTLMLADRMNDPEEGLLLYLKQPVMKPQPAKYANKRGLIQLRNEIAYHMQHDLKTSDSIQSALSALPKPINSERTCLKCPQLINCAAYQRMVEYPDNSKEQIPAVFSDSLAHLNPVHLQYYYHWCLLISMEIHSSSQNSRKGQNKDIWCQNSQVREKNGHCFSKMVLVGDVKQETQSFLHNFGRYKLVEVDVKNMNDIGLNVGDSIVVSAENMNLIALCMGYITEITSNQVSCKLDRDLSQQENLKQAVYRIDKNESTTAILSCYTNLTKLMENSPSRERLREMIIEKRVPQTNRTLSKAKIGKVKDIFKRLNKSQKSALLKVMMSQDYTVIKGYPGTGKTHTIVALVRALHSLGYSVLLTSYTNTAVDNILLKLKEHNLDFIRFGQLHKIHPALHENSATTLTSHISTVDQLEEFYNSKSIVATTCLGTSHPIFKRRSFDICVIDEASQVLQPACLAPLFCSQKFVLIGDPEQLPPVIQSKEAKELHMDESLLKRLDDTGATCELTLQYRMNSKILSLSNHLIYGGLLQCGTKTVEQATLRANTVPLQNDPTWLQQTLRSDLDTAVVLISTEKLVNEKTQAKEAKNEVEADLINCIVQAAIKAEVNKDDIGVIALYRQQVSLIRQVLDQHGCGRRNFVEVNTVDQYQGRDKSLIIVSFVRTGEQKSVSEILKDKRRLNVAITRAKHKLILVGHCPTLRKYPVVDQLLELIKVQNVLCPAEIPVK